MVAPLEPVTLSGDLVRLVPLSLDHAPALTAAAALDRSTYSLTPVPDDEAGMRAYIEHLLDEHAQALGLPFTQIDARTDEPAGCTRYLYPHWFSGRAEPDEVEIGGTWLAATAQRTGINTEAKLLLLQHAFEVFCVWRVQLCTDARNERSRTAIERVGARFEGILRNHRVAYDAGEPTPRQTAVFSITADEWPDVKAALQAKLDR